MEAETTSDPTEIRDADQGAPDDETRSPSSYMARRTYTAAVLLVLALIGVSNPLNFVVVDRYLNHFFAATIIITALMFDVLRRGDSHEWERTPAVGRTAMAVMATYWIVCVWGAFAMFKSPMIGVVVCVLLAGAFIMGARKLRPTWPARELLVPLVLVCCVTPFAGFGYFLTHGPVTGSSRSPFNDVRIDHEQTDGGCPGIYYWLRRGDGLTERQVLLDNECSTLTFVAPDRLETACYRGTGRDHEEYVARTLNFDPVSLRILSDTGAVKCG